MNDNLPVKTMEQILTKPETELSEKERKAKALYLKMKEEQEVDTTSHTPQAQVVEVLHGHEQFKFPDDTLKTEFEGIIVYAMKRRTYYDPNESDGPLLCSSVGAIQGRATDVGREQKPFLSGDNYCIGCAADEFGTGKNGRGRACKEFRSMLLFVPGFRKPLKLNAPLMSCKNFDVYYDKVDAADKMLSAVWTKFELEHAGSGSEQYSRLTFMRGEDLPWEQWHELMQMKTTFEDQIGTMSREEFEKSDLAGRPSGQEVKQQPASAGEEPPPVEDDDLPF